MENFSIVRRKLLAKKKLLAEEKADNEGYTSFPSRRINSPVQLI